MTLRKWLVLTAWFNRLFLLIMATKNSPSPADQSLERSAELIQLFRKQLGKKQFNEIENTWLELIETEMPLNELLGVVELVVKWAPPDVASIMLSLLATRLWEKGRYEEELLVLRQLITNLPQPAEETKRTLQLTNCLKLLYKDESLLERILQKSGLGYGIPLREALVRFDQLINLTPNRLVYDQEYGLGKVKNLDLLLDRVTILFSSGAEITFDIVTANQRFHFPLKDDFFFLLTQNQAEILELIQKDSGGVVAMLLRGLNRPMTPTEIQKVFEPLVGRENYARFWEKAKKELSRNPNIKIQSKPISTYQWTKAAAEKITGRARGKEKAGREGGRFNPLITQSLNCYSNSMDEVVEQIKSLRNYPARKKYLQELPELRPGDWAEIFQRLFLAEIDTRTRVFIANFLQKEKPEMWEKIVNTILNEYRFYPSAFLFVIENFPLLAPVQCLWRLLDLSENPSFRNRIKKILVKENYHLIRSVLKEGQKPDTERLLARIKRLRVLEKFQEDEITTLMPSDSQTESEKNQVIWSSIEGIEKARAELKRLLREELPRTAEEIARARAQGDLSENYEYKAAKEKQARLMERINRLREDLARARPLRKEAIDLTQVVIGCRVQLAGEEEKIYEYAILGPWDSDPERGIISYQSPLGQSLLGKKVGEVIEMNGKKWTITEIAWSLEH